MRILTSSATPWGRATGQPEDAGADRDGMELTDTTRTTTPTPTRTSTSAATATSTLTLGELLAELGVADDEALPRFWD